MSRAPWPTPARRRRRGTATTGSPLCDRGRSSPVHRIPFAGTRFPNCGRRRAASVTPGPHSSVVGEFQTSKPRTTRITRTLSVRRPADAWPVGHRRRAEATRKNPRDANRGSFWSSRLDDHPRVRAVVSGAASVIRGQIDPLPTRRHSCSATSPNYGQMAIIQT